MAMSKTSNDYAPCVQVHRDGRIRKGMVVALAVAMLAGVLLSCAQGVL